MLDKGRTPNVARYENVLIEVALSGNGALREDGTAPAAEHLQALTRDMSEVQTSIATLARKISPTWPRRSPEGEDVPLRRP